MTRGSKKKKETFQITSKIHKELQNVIIWVCFDKCYQNKRMSDVARKQMVYDLYYGKKDKPDEMTFVDQFIQGMGVFSVLFDKIPISTTDVEEDPEEFELHLNQIFHRDNSKKFIVGKHITKDRLVRLTLSKAGAKKGDDYLIPMSTLFNRGQRILTEGRKALAHSYHKSIYDASKPTEMWCPSGKKLPDYEHYILQAMRLEGKKNPSVLVEDSDDDDDDDDNDDDASSSNNDDDVVATDVDNISSVILPNGWFFTGWWGFRAFGPRPITQNGRDSLLILVTDDNTKNKSPAERKQMGRAASRELEKLEKHNDRQLATGVIGNSRGMSRVHELQLIQIASQNASAKEKEASGAHDRLMFNLSLKTTDVQKLREQYMDAVKHRSKLGDEFVGSLKNDLDEAREAKRFIEAELEEVRTKDSTSVDRAIVNAYLEPHHAKKVKLTNINDDENEG
jgi:hypothetical protein